MRILFVADGRSSLTHNWLKYFLTTDFEVHLISTYPCSPMSGLASFQVLPVAFSNLGKEVRGIPLNDQFQDSKLSRKTLIRKIIPVKSRTWIRQQLGPYTLPQASRRLKEIIQRIEPDLIHAMRIPFEGMLTTIAIQDIPKIPLMVSVWGNDFTLHAPSSRMMTNYTRQVMIRADALHTDTYRDQLLAQEWGFNAKNPVIVQPCAGGVNADIFYPSSQENKQGTITIINPRGFRAYVRNDTFFRSIPIIIKEFRDISVICPAMQGEVQAMKWMDSLDIASYVRLLPLQSSEEMADLFRQSDIIASITTHDGIPNSLLEAMACGCFPIVGDVDSLREWITPGENGFIVDPGDPIQLAESILRAIRDLELRTKAREVNFKMVEERVEYRRRMAELAEFYQSLILVGT